MTTTRAPRSRPLRLAAGAGLAVGVVVLARRVLARRNGTVVRDVRNAR